jgi:hypothetical protein
MKTIEESGMTFEFCEDNLFHIENCNTVKNLGEGVKKVEMAVMLNKKLAFIEAKSSSPAPDNQDKFDEYIQGIYEKFRNSLLLLTGIALDRPFKAKSQLPKNIDVNTIGKSKIHFYLIIKGYKDEWLPSLNDALKFTLHAIAKCFVIDKILVLNDTLAREYKLIK